MTGVFFRQKKGPTVFYPTAVFYLQDVTKSINNQVSAPLGRFSMWVAGRRTVEAQKDREVTAGEEGLSVSVSIHHIFPPPRPPRPREGKCSAGYNTHTHTQIVSTWGKMVFLRGN